MLLAFSILLLVPTLGRIEMHKFLFSNTTTLISDKRLEFTNAMVVKGTLTNTSRFNLESCRITANVHKVSKNSLKNYLFQFKTIKKMSILKYDIKKDKTINFKIIVEPFAYTKDYDITLGAKCK